MESEARRENSHAHVAQCTLLPLQEEMSLASPEESDTTLLPQQAEEKIPRAQQQLSQWDTARTQPMKATVL